MGYGNTAVDNFDGRSVQILSIRLVDATNLISEPSKASVSDIISLYE